MPWDYQKLQIKSYTINYTYLCIISDIIGFKFLQVKYDLKDLHGQYFVILDMKNYFIQNLRWRLLYTGYPVT
jgi:hypothetical protein